MYQIRNIEEFGKKERKIYKYWVNKMLFNSSGSSTGWAYCWCGGYMWVR